MCPLCEKQHSRTAIKLCMPCFEKLELERRGAIARSKEPLAS